MDIDQYEKNIREIYEAKAILEGIKDMQDSNTLDGKFVISKLRDEYEI